MPQLTKPGSATEAEDAQNLQLHPDDWVFRLTKREIAWRERQDILEDHGYVLRPRFRRGWSPSWRKPGQEKGPAWAEDSYRHWKTSVIDATRVSDGRRVYLKIVHPTGVEQRIARKLSPEGDMKDPRNHCVPVLDFFISGQDGYLVMPLLIRFNVPPFSFVDEVLDFIRQTLEGLSFIHSRNVAHRDCSILNIMMDASELYPHGFHPTFPMYAADGIAPSNPRYRRDVPSVRYIYTDFGISVDFKDTDELKLSTGVDGQDQDVPELSNTVPYDPFAVDVFILGNLYRKALIEKYINLAFLSPLSQAMTRKDPSGRPIADESIKIFNEIITGQRAHVLKRRLIPASEGRLKRFLLHIGCVSQESLAALRKVFSETRFPLKRTQGKNADR